MRMKLFFTLTPDGPIQVLWTSLFVIATWEQTENRRMSDGRGIGATELACWAYLILKLRGDKMPETFMKWLEENPDVDVTMEDRTDVNPTDAATVAN